MSALPTITSEGCAKLESFLGSVVGSRRVPAMFVGATNAQEEIYWSCAGDKVFGDPSQGEVNSDTMTELWSQTKFLTCICAMQLVDRGLTSLDSYSEISKHLPELAERPLLQGYDKDGKAILEKPKNRITLRMLMSHTAGLAYPSNSPELAKHLEMNPIPSQVESGSGIESLLVPLVYEPGSSWRYSNAIDWVGLFVERVSGIAKLGDYMKEHIFIPTGATSLTFEPEDAAYDNKMTVCERIKGEIVHTPTGGVFGRARGQPSASFHFGGQGLYGTQRDYLRVLRGVLRSDPRWNATQGGEPILTAESYRELFKPSVPLDNAAKGLDGPSRLVEMVGRPQYISPPATPESVNHSIACLVTLQDLDERRKAGSGCWSGVAKSQWWLDPVTGLAGVCATQLLGPAPDCWFEVYVDYEKRVYAGLA